MPGKTSTRYEPNELENIVIDEIEVEEMKQALANFCLAVKSGMLRQSLKPKDVFEFYKEMEPSIHPNCNNPKIDVGAIKYALDRLPYEITVADLVYIRKDSPNFIGMNGIQPVSTKSRRRTCFKGRQGNLEIVALDSDTDLYDIVSTSTMLSIEALKMQKKLKDWIAESPSFYNRISDKQQYVEGETKNQFLMELADVLHMLPEEIRKLDSTLNGNMHDFLTKILTHDYSETNIRFDEGFTKTVGSNTAKRWRKELEVYLKDLNDGRPVDIVSSNTWGLVDCLTDFSVRYKKDLVALAKEDPILKGLNPDIQNNLYFITQRLAAQNKAVQDAKLEYEAKHGITMVPDVSSCGINVQMIDTSKINFNNIDDRIKNKIKNHDPRIIINIDYAFGMQGREIMWQLFELLGKRIDSVSVTGKAGTLCGKKYDIMIPSGFLYQIELPYFSFPKNGNDLTAQEISEFVDEDCTIHTNRPMLSVPGTAIQNAQVLKYYKSKYKVLGDEMEGVPYMGAIKRARVSETLRSDVKVRACYWASDCPLDQNQLLSEDHMEKGLSPTYAIILGILPKILNGR
jgi:hypothetical protein